MQANLKYTREASRRVVMTKVILVFGVCGDGGIKVERLTRTSIHLTISTGFELVVTQ